MARSRIGVAGVTSDWVEKAVDPGGAAKEADTSWTFTLIAAKAPPTSNGGHGFAAEMVESGAGPPAAPGVGSRVTPHERFPAAFAACTKGSVPKPRPHAKIWRSEVHTSELQSLAYLVCRLLLVKKN